MNRRISPYRDKKAPQMLAQVSDSIELSGPCGPNTSPEFKGIKTRCTHCENPSHQTKYQP